VVVNAGTRQETLETSGVAQFVQRLVLRVTFKILLNKLKSSNKFMIKTGYLEENKRANRKGISAPRRKLKNQC